MKRRTSASAVVGVFVAFGGAAACTSAPGLEAVASVDAGDATFDPRDAGPETAAFGDGGPDTAVTDGGTPSVRLPSGVNALIVPGAAATDSPLPLYRLPPGGANEGLAFQQRGDVLAALDARGQTLWEKSVGAGTLFGGFDIDRDGWPDFGLVRAVPNGQTCGSTPVMNSSIDLGLGRTGSLFPGVVPALPDICWQFGQTIYPTQQWTKLGVLFGASTDALVLVPQYTSTTAAATVPFNEGKATAIALRNGAITKLGDIIMPSVPAYDAFPAARLEPHGSGLKHYIGTHVPNGLLAGSASSPELRFFTSGRAVVYQAQAPFSLLQDYPYLSGARTDTVGRNYGLVAIDPARSSNTVLLAGTSAFSMDADMRSGTLAYDPWAGVERHVSIHDAASNAVVDRFFSYAHDANDSHKYEGRVVYPNTPFLAPSPGSVAPSRLLFNVYAGGRWRATITAPGSIATARELVDLFVWDVRDLDGDGVAEVIASPSKDAAEPDVSGYYFVKWRTQLFHWDEGTSSLVFTRSFEGGLPWLAASFPTSTTTSSVGALYPVLTVAVDDHAAVVLRERDGTRRVEPL